MRKTFHALMLLLALLLAGCDSPVQLFAAMSERDANEVVSSLSDAGITARKVPGKDGIAIEVPQSAVARSLAHLNNEGLPHERRTSMGDVFRKEGLISSPLEERARYLWALSQELSETVSQIDGVLRARVHVVLPERSSGGDPPMPSSAAVFVKYRRGVNLDDAVPQIRRLVASSIPGLQPDKVSVVLVAAAPHAPAGTARARDAEREWLPAALAGVIALTLAGAAFAGWRMTRARAASADESAEAVEPEAAA